MPSLCALRWSFSDGLQNPALRPDGLLHMELYPPLRWHFNASGSVQIENFPEHTVHRHAPDWGWVVRNCHVEFRSRDGPRADVRPMPEAPTPAEFRARFEEMQRLARQAILRHVQGAARRRSQEDRAAADGAIRGS